MVINVKFVYKCILLKLSGEVLQGLEGFGIDVSIFDCMVQEIKELVELGIQVGVVIGGGNLFCGVGLVKVGMNCVVGDYMGMLVMVMNGFVMCDVFYCVYVNVCLMFVILLNGVCDNYSWVEVISLLCNNCVVIFFVGIGNLFFIIDFVVCLCGIEIEVDVVLKVIKVDGVFIVDLVKDFFVIMYDQLIYSEVLEKELKVMDLVVFILVCDYKLLICVFNMNKSGVLCCVVMGEKEGILIME